MQFLLVPSFVPHPDDSPAGSIGIRNPEKARRFNSNCTGMAKRFSEEVLDGGDWSIAEFALHDAHDFAVMDGGIELLDM